MFKLFSRRKELWQQDSKYPLSLGAEQIKALTEFRNSEAHDAFQEVVRWMAERRALQLMRPSTVEEHNFDRGVLFCLSEVYDVVDRIVTKVEEMTEYERKQRRNGDGNADDGTIGKLWGNPNFTDHWRR